MFCVCVRMNMYICEDVCVFVSYTNTYIIYGDAYAHCEMKQMFMV